MLKWKNVHTITILHVPCTAKVSRDEKFANQSKIRCEPHKLFNLNSAKIPVYN